VISGTAVFIELVPFSVPAFMVSATRRARLRTTGRIALGPMRRCFAVGCRRVHVYTHTTLNDATGSAYVGNFANPASSLKFDNFGANARYQFVKNAFVGAMYNYTLGHFNGAAGDSKPKWHEFGLMADYNLSPRTDVYVQAMYRHLAGGSASAAPLNTAFITGADSPSTTANQVITRIAIRHQF
jgi:predicted porin